MQIVNHILYPFRLGYTLGYTIQLVPLILLAIILIRKYIAPVR